MQTSTTQSIDMFEDADHARRLAESDGSDSGDELTWQMVAITAGMAIILIVILTLMGLKISYDDLKGVKSKGCVPIATVAFGTYVMGPVICVALALALRLKTEWCLGLMVFSVTPPTVASCVIAFMAGADVALALAAVLVALCFAIVAMPGMFAAGMGAFHAFGGGEAAATGKDIRLQLPIGQIVGTMAMLLACCVVGVALNAKLTPEKKLQVEKWLKRMLIPVFPCVTIGFVTTPGLVQSSFYTGEGGMRFWAGAVLIHVAALPAAGMLTALASRLNPAGPFSPKARDAIIISIIRRNPAIAMGVAALSFSSAEDIDFDTAFGMVMAGTMPMEIVSVPMLLIMRKLRYGTYCTKQADDAEEGEPKQTDPPEPEKVKTAWTEISTAKQP